MALTVPFRGVIEIVGEHDTGKTLAALGVVSNYKRTVFVDDDMKGDATIQQLIDAGFEFSQYHNLSELRSLLGDTPSPTDLVEKVVKPTIEKIVKTGEKKRFEVIVWDTWGIVYQSVRQHVERNQSDYSHMVKFQGNSIIIQGLISRVAREIERSAIQDLKSVCDLLIVTHHIKAKYSQNIEVGVTPESSRTWEKVCNMRLWLRRNPRSKIPIILFPKRPNLPKKSGNKIKFTNVVPLKITPTDKHESIWEAIQEYVDNPIESREPNESETPTADEYSALSGSLNDEQKAYVIEAMAYQKRMANELDPIAKSMTSLDEEADESTAPVNGVQLITMAKNRLDINSKKLAKQLGLSVKEITELKPVGVKKIWEKLNE